MLFSFPRRSRKQRFWRITLFAVAYFRAGVMDERSLGLLFA